MPQRQTQRFQRLREGLFALAWLLLCAFVYHVSLKEFLFPGDIWIAVFFGICTAVIILCSRRELCERIRQSSTRVLLPAVICIAMLAAVLIRNGDLARGNYGKPFFSAFAVILFFLALFLPQGRVWCKRFAVLFSLEHACFTWLFYFLPSFYKNHVLVLFPDFYEELSYQFEHRQMAGLTSHYSINAIYLTVGFLILVCELISQMRNRQRLSRLRVAAVVFLFSALLLTGKRAHLLFSVAAVAAVFLLANLRQLRQSIRRFWWILPVCIAGIALCSVFIPSLSAAFVRMFSGSDITNGRLPLYRLALEKFYEHPLFGIGWGEYKYQYALSGISGTQPIMETHNVYLQVLCESGIIGFLLFAVSFLAVFVKALRSIVCREENLSSELLISMGIQVFFFLYCLTGNPLYDIPMLYPFVLACAASCGQENREVTA